MYYYLKHLFLLVIFQQSEGRATLPSTAFSPFGGLPLEIGLDFSNIYKGSKKNGNFSYEVNEYVEGLDSFLENLTSSDVGKEVTFPEKLTVRVETDIESKLEDWNITTDISLENLTVVLSDPSDIDPCTAAKLVTVKNASKAVLKAKLNPKKDGSSSSKYEEERKELQQTYNYTSEEVIAAVEQVLNSPSIQLIIRNQVYPECDKSEEYSDGSYTEFQIDPGARALLYTLLGLIIGTFLYSIYCAGCFMGCCCLRNAKETEKEAEFLDQFNSLVKTPLIPVYFRYLFYLVVLVNVGFFISANMSVGATIDVSLVAAGEVIELPSIYDFSMLLSTIEMMKAGVILMGVILMGFSIFWPYIKLIIMTLVWSLPASKMRPDNRGCLLEWLDALGKWSMFDVFCLCVMMVVFNVEIVSPEWFVFPLGYYGFTLSMTCVWGMYANLIAQIISQLLSIYAIKSHRKVFKSDWLRLKEAEAPNALPQDASVPTFEVGRLCDREILTKEGTTVKPTLMSKYGMSLILIAVAVMVGTAFFVSGFNVRVVGILGLVQEAAIPGSSTRYFSPFTIARFLNDGIPPDSPGQAVGTWCIILVMAICTSLVPMAQALVLLFLWTKKTASIKLIKRLLFANELLASWQYIEVYLIAVAVGCAQLPLMCNLLVSKACADIQPQLNELVAEGVMDRATCLSMDTTIEAGIWLHFLASIMLYVGASAVRQAGYSILRQYDAFTAAQKKEFSEKQKHYFSRRTKQLICFRLVSNVHDDSAGKLS